MTGPGVFISYSWDDPGHRTWVRELASRLRSDGINVTIDQWVAALGDQLPAIMERAVSESYYVLIICTPQYKLRSDGRRGGVGYEGDVMTGEIFVSANHRKFIPILRKGDWEDAAPAWLLGKYYADLRGEPYAETEYRTLVATLSGMARSQAATTAHTAPSSPPAEAPRTLQDLRESSAREIFLQGRPDSSEFGLHFSGFVFDKWLSRHGKSLVGRFKTASDFVVAKRTPRQLCDFKALEALASAEITGTDNRVDSRLATPIAVRQSKDAVFELHHYYRGLPLESVVRRNRYRISGHYLASLHNSLVDALEQLHRRGLVHRDVRPANFLFLPEGNVILLDCSFVTSSGKQNIPVNAGTYTAPEQREGKAVSASDWYSLAASMVFVALGAPPAITQSTALRRALSKVDTGSNFYISSSLDSRLHKMYEEEGDGPHAYPMVADWRGHDRFPPAYAWAEMLQSDVARRPRNSWEMRFHQSSAAMGSRPCLESVLDLEEFGLLLICDTELRLVSSETLSSAVSRTFIESDALRQSVDNHLQGRPDWSIS